MKRPPVAWSRTVARLGQDGLMTECIGQHGVTDPFARDAMDQGRHHGEGLRGSARGVLEMSVRWSFIQTESNTSCSPIRAQAASSVGQSTACGEVLIPIAMRRAAVMPALPGEWPSSALERRRHPPAGRDRPLRRGRHEGGVLRHDAARVARLWRRPARAPRGELGVVHEDIEPARGDVDLDLVAFLDERSARRGRPRARRGRSSGRACRRRTGRRSGAPPNRPAPRRRAPRVTLSISCIPGPPTDPRSGSRRRRPAGSGAPSRPRSRRSRSRTPGPGRGATAVRGRRASRRSRPARSEPRRMASPPVGLSGVSIGTTTFWPGVSTAAAATSASVRPSTFFSSPWSRSRFRSSRMTSDDAAGVVQVRRGVAAAGVQVGDDRRAAAIAPNSSMSSAIPNSWAIARRCRTPFVERRSRPRRRWRCRARRG